MLIVRNRSSTTVRQILVKMKAIVCSWPTMLDVSANVSEIGLESVAQIVSKNNLFFGFPLFFYSCNVRIKLSSLQSTSSENEKLLGSRH